MRKYYYAFIHFLLHALSQELNCNVVVNAQQTGNENVQFLKL